MKKILQNTLLVLLLLVTGWVNAQNPVLTISCPATADDWVTITYYADAGCTPTGKGNVAGLPYIGIHSGVTTAAGSWQFVKSWNETPQNIIDTKMYPESGTNNYKITILPREFYGVPSTEDVTGINCVFNGSDNDANAWDSEGKNPDNGCNDFSLAFADCSGTGIGNNSQDAIQLRNSPNPFATSTQISYFTSVDGQHASLKIYNLQGQAVKTLTSANHIAGQHFVSWDGIDENGTSVPSGQYLIVLETETTTSTAKMLVVR